MAGIVPTPFTTLPEPLPPGASAPPVPAGGDDLVWPTSGADTGGAGDQWKQPVRCAATGALTIASGLLTGAAVDGVTLAAGDRVLLTGQSAPAENGIYTAGATPARAPDMDQDDEVLGALVYVIAGTASGGTVWRCTNTTAPVLGTTALAFAQFGTSAPAGTYELATGGGQAVIKAHGSLGAAATFSPADGNVHTGTLTANCTVTLAAPVGTGACTLELWLTEDGTGGWTVAWPGSVTEQGTHATTLGTTSRVIVESVDGGTTWIAAWLGGSGGGVGTFGLLVEDGVTAPPVNLYTEDGTDWLYADG